MQGTNLASTSTKRRELQVAEKYRNGQNIKKPLIEEIQYYAPANETKANTTGMKFKKNMDPNKKPNVKIYQIFEAYPEIGNPDPKRNCQNQA